MTINCNMQTHDSSELALPTLMFFISSNSMEKIVASLIYQNLIVLQIVIWFLAMFSLSPFYNPWKYQKTFDFLMF